MNSPVLPASTRHAPLFKFGGKRKLSAHGVEIIALVTLSIQLALGASFFATLVIYFGTFIGFLASKVAGGLKTAGGILMAWFTLGTTGIALLMKTLCWESWVSRIDLPMDVAAVYLIGYLGLLCAACVYKIVSVPGIRRIYPSAKTWTAIALFLLVTGVSIPFIAGDHYGGLWGALKNYGRLGTLSIIAATAASCLKHPQRKWWHPFPLGVMTIYIGFAIISTGKEGFVVAGLSFVLSLLIFRRISMRSFIGAMVVGMLAVIFVIGPYSDTVRYTAVKNMRGWGRVSGAYHAFFQMFDPQIRNAAQAKVRYQQDRERSSRFTDAKIGYLERFMTIASGKELIQAAIRKGTVGWKMIISDITVLVPRFLFPNKAFVNSNYFYGRYSGIIPVDWTGAIGISFGPFPVFFAGGGFAAVFIMSSLGFGIIFGGIKIIEIRFPGPVTRCMLFIALWHTIVEGGSPIDSIYTVIFLFLTLLFFSIVGSGSRVPQVAASGRVTG